MARLSDVAVVVQARTGSARLPNKILLPFGDTTVLGHILDRLGRAGLPLWVATTEAPADDAVAAAAGRVAVARGPEDDVLARFLGCVDSMPQRPKALVRICADRPLVGPDLVAEIVRRWRLLGEPDYVANNLPPSFPYGLDVEVVTVAALERAHEEADAYEREHVTPFVYRRPEAFWVHGVMCPYGNFASVRAALDTPEDYERLCRAHELLVRLQADYDWHDVLTLVSLEPEVLS